MSNNTGLIQIQNNDWDRVIEAVSYPVEIVPLYWDNNPDATCIEDTSFNLAIGDTNTGRDTQFFGVNVDRDRTGDFATIAVVTDTYGTLNTAGVYRDFQADLEDIDLEYDIHSVYISGNGGSHLLRINSREVSDILPDIRMQLTLQTSVDGTKRHLLRLSAFDIKRNVELFGVSGSALTVSARHTKTVGERHAAFTTLITKFITEWKDTIVPMMSLMGTTEIDISDAIDMVRDSLEKAKIPERHIERASLAFSGNGKITALEVSERVSEYFSEALEGRQERYEMFRDKISRQLEKAIDKLIK